MKVWDVTPPSSLMVSLAKAEAQHRARLNRKKRENFERARIRKLVGHFDTFGVIIADEAVLFVYDKRMPENSHIIRERI